MQETNKYGKLGQEETRKLSIDITHGIKLLLLKFLTSFKPPVYHVGQISIRK